MESSAAATHLVLIKLSHSGIHRRHFMLEDSVLVNTVQPVACERVTCFGNSIQFTYTPVYSRNISATFSVQQRSVLLLSLYLSDAI